MGGRKCICGNGDQGNEGKAWHAEGEDCFRQNQGRSRLLHQRIPCQKDSGALQKVLQSLVAVEPKSEVASGQEYARRYRKLLDQHAEAQIEPLLTEWRDKAPDDPQAWITSANYYF